MENIDPNSINGAMIRKSNELIEAKYQIHDIGEQRVIFMLLAQIQPNDEDFKRYRLSVSNFAKVLGLTGNSTYETLDRIASSLVSRKISIRNEKSFLHMNWLSSAKYEYGSGYIELSFDPNLKPYLLQLKSHFTQYKLDNVLHFKSQYSIRLYEFLKKESFKAKNNKFEKNFNYEELREIFSIGKEEYLLFGHFKSKTINPAVLEISAKSDLNIYDIQYGKTGRKITNITFYVLVQSKDETYSKQANLLTEDIKPEKKSENHPIVDELVNLGFSLEIAKKYKNKHGIKKIERNIAYTLAKNQERNIDVPSYLNKAIENDYGNAWEIKQKKEAEKQKTITATKKATEQQNVEKNDKIIREFFKFPDEKRQALIKEFLAISDSTTRKLTETPFKELGENAIKENKVARSLFLGFLKKSIIPQTH